MSSGGDKTKLNNPHLLLQRFFESREMYKEADDHRNLDLKGI
jgi:hypothetical protein